MPKSGTHPFDTVVACACAVLIGKLRVKTVKAISQPFMLAPNGSRHFMSQMVGNFIATKKGALELPRLRVVPSSKVTVLSDNIQFGIVSEYRK